MTAPRSPSGGLRALRSGLRALVDPAHRRQLVRFYWHKNGAFQPNDHTLPNRYPWAFDSVLEYLGADSEGRVLSFGCSTGEEVAAIRARLPHVTIRGLDIDAPSIATARKRLAEAGGDERIEFAVAASPADEPDSAYDVIFCMAVLRDGRLNVPGTERCDPLLHFDDFAGVIADFARCLRPGGLLVLRHSNFRLCDTPSAPLFRTIHSVPMGSHTLIFGPDNRVMPGVRYPDAIFLRL
jgi:2-polyprenyl-3-methyl-5-hydroxy-6-metoxy-1,4-benzoquinol methylase